MQTIEAELAEVNPQAASEVIQFVDKMAERGVYHPTTAKLRSYALRRILTVLGADEPTDPASLLDNMDALVNRLGRLNQESPATLKDYRGRASKLLKDFIEYQRDPLGFQKTVSEARPPKDSKKAAQPGKKLARSVGDAQPDAPSPPPRPVVQPLRTFPLANGQDIGYILPEPRHTAEDALRFALHLLTLAVDFDPMRPEQARFFTLARVRRDEADQP